MLITRIYLRNFRVFEDELDLHLPPGLVGIYGPNGAGKSTLLEAILFTFWGRARTSKDEIRSAGVGGDCVTEVEFEHEGHLYVVRRRLTGINATPRASVTCDGLQVTEGVREVGRYVHSLLGMDDAAFRASVFAEQKQLAAFSGQSPADRRKLVLQLLGITPLDAARDSARRDARMTRERHDNLRTVLPDVDALTLEAADAEAEAGAAEAGAAEASASAEAASAVARTASEKLSTIDRVRQEYDRLVVEGTAARNRLDQLTDALSGRRKEIAGLDQISHDLAGLQREIEELPERGDLVAPLRALARAAREVVTFSVPPEPPPPDSTRADSDATAARAARERLGEVEGELKASKAELDRAKTAAHRSGQLSNEADCPLCGQALGEAWEQVRSHRLSEVETVEARVAERVEMRKGALSAAATADEEFQRSSAEFRAASTALQEWERLAARRKAIRQAESDARAELAELDPAMAAAGGEAGPDSEPSQIEAAADRLEKLTSRRRHLEGEAQRLRGRLDARPSTEAAIAELTEKLAIAETEVSALRDKVRSLGFDKVALEEARNALVEADRQASEARTRAEQSRLFAATVRARALASEQRVQDARAQHAKLAELASESLHLSRVADLLSEFRNTVVASVGPRLALQAAELFAELTDHEYDELQVDPETYGLQISDAGRVYGLERFSGSEIDLANLALRVAISEHIRFQSGGSVGLLVLDEVFGPLDEERKERMLNALERLKGRFRQVLVVTHDGTIKEQLPNAIEVVKLPGRRASARLLAG